MHVLHFYGLEVKPSVLSIGLSRQRADILYIRR